MRALGFSVIEWNEVLVDRMNILKQRLRNFTAVIKLIALVYLDAATATVVATGFPPSNRGPSYAHLCLIRTAPIQLILVLLEILERP